MVLQKPELPIVSREDWGARPPQELSCLNHPVKYVRVVQYPSLAPTCSTAADCEQVIRERQQFDMENLGWPDIQPNFLVGNDGRIYEGRGWSFKTDIHTNYEKYDGNMLDIAYLGPFMKGDVPPLQFINHVFDLATLALKKKYITEDFEVLIDEDHVDPKENPDRVV